MVRRRCVELLLGMMLVAALPLVASDAVDHDAYWPRMMSAELMISDANLARLQDRANASLERMLRSGTVIE